MPICTPHNAEGILTLIGVSEPFGSLKEQSSGLYLNATTIDQRVKITVSATMYEVRSLNKSI